MSATPVPKTADQVAAEHAAQVKTLQDQLAAALQALSDLSPKDALPAAPVNPIIYHSSSPFIKVPIMRAPGFCDFVQFINGSLETSDPAVIAVLEAAIKSQGSGFFHGTPPETDASREAVAAVLAAMAAAAHAKMLAAGEKTA